MPNPNLIPTVLVDKNGHQTTRNKRSTSFAPVGRTDALSAPQPATEPLVGDPYPHDNARGRKDIPFGTKLHFADAMGIGEIIDKHLYLDLSHPRNTHEVLGKRLRKTTDAIIERTGSSASDAELTDLVKEFLWADFPINYSDLGTESFVAYAPLSDLRDFFVEVANIPTDMD